MNAYTASLLNAICLVVLGTWGYFASDSPSMTAFIPVVIGGILLACSSGIRKENKVIAHVAVLLTLLILFGLIKPLTGAIGREDTMAVLRVGIMMITTVVAIVYFVKSFIDARRNK